jgi:2'-5' RNA ligase
MLALMPPEELARDIERIRFDFSQKYKAVAALKPPVHITLVPPYKAAANTEAAIVDALEAWAPLQIPFPVTIQNYNTFRNNGVIYLDVAANELLQLFQKDIVTKFRQVMHIPGIKTGKSYHPHITIGYRDIPPEVFDTAADEYLAKKFFSVFVANSFYLWKHDTKRWQVLHSFTIGNRI